MYSAYDLNPSLYAISFCSDKSFNACTWASSADFNSAIYLLYALFSACFFCLSVLSSLADEGVPLRLPIVTPCCFLFAKASLACSPNFLPLSHISVIALLLLLECPSFHKPLDSLKLFA